MRELTGVSIVLFFDQLSKFLVRRYMYPGQEIKIFSFFSFTYVQNTGGLFGFLVGNNTVLLVLTFLVLGILWWQQKAIFPALSSGRISFILIFGGGLGNLFDRIFWGGVIDFLDFYLGRFHWPAFNFADVSVNLGIVFWLLAMVKNQRGKNVSGTF